MVGLACVVAPGTAAAGNGAFRGGVFNFCVSIRFNASAAELARIRAAFQAGSQVLADATDGQHRLGTVCLVNDSGASESAEYWVHPGSGRAYATAGRYGERGQHVNLFFDSNFQARSGADGDAYTIAHEHVHHAYGVLDEYSGPSGAAEDAPPPDTATLSYSLMDNYFTRGGRAFGSTYTLNELCVATNHDPDHDTWQHNTHGRSAWETVAAHPTRSATLPAGLPVDTPPAPHTVNFRDAVGSLRVILVLDRSGSMALENRLEYAKQGAVQFLNFLRVGDAVGVVSFDSASTINFPLTPITTGGGTGGAEAAINSIALGGATNIGGGLQDALSQLTAQATRSCNEIIVLLSDGDHNTGPHPSTVIPSLQNENITVLTVGVGTGISVGGQATLQTVATQTGGKFFRVSSAPDLVGLFMQLSAESTGSGLLTRSPLTIGGGQTVESPVQIEAGVTSATFAAVKTHSADAITLSLVTPSGQVIRETDVGTVPGVRLFTGPNSRSLQVQDPAPGRWGLRVTAGVVSDGRIETLAFAAHDGVRLDVAPTRDIVAYPGIIELHATPAFRGQRVVGASIAGTVRRPDGTGIAVVLWDDGASTHGDAMAGDGEYSTLFADYSEDGTYVFVLDLANTAGFAYAGEDLFDIEPSNSAPIEPFVRQATTTVVVTGVPAGVDTTPPVIDNAPDLTIEATSAAGAVVAYVAPATHDDRDGDGIATCTPAAGTIFPLGRTTVTCSATDRAGNSASRTFNVTVVDSTPPRIAEVLASPDALWPPNHRLVPVKIQPHVSDLVDPAPRCEITSVSSNEPTKGLGQGDRSPDWVVTSALKLQLRAERSGKGNGRVYTVAVRCADVSQNVATGSVDVRVPHSK